MVARIHSTLIIVYGFFALVSGSSHCNADDLQILHSFGNAGSKVYDSPSSLILQGTMFYGTTMGMVPQNRGTLFQIRTDGTCFNVLHTFKGGANDAAGPAGALTFSSGILFGMSIQGGGENDCGTIYSIKTDGSAFTLLHRFLEAQTPVTQDGEMPDGTLNQIDEKFYGMTPSGGGLGDPNGNGKGVIFSIKSDGTGFTILHAFAGGEVDGANPTGSLACVQSMLYGITQTGGKNDLGVLFQISKNGSAFKVLYSFGADIKKGFNPLGVLAVAGKTFYGATWLGGGRGYGTPFRFDLLSNSRTTIRAFDDAEEKPLSPGELSVCGKFVYGFARRGGRFGCGCVYRFNLDGNDFKILHSFAGAPADGDMPCSAPIVFQSALYGLTFKGGQNDRGTIYKLPSPSEH